MALAAQVAPAGVEDVFECDVCEPEPPRSVCFFHGPNFGRRCLECAQICCVSCTTDGCSAPICQDHETCWTKHVADKPRRSRAKHQMADPRVALIVNTIMRSDKDEAIRRLHLKDRLARWFFVDRQGIDEKPSLWLHDRFIGVCDPDRHGGATIEKQYPGLVCFIGKTSVGKSSIVRAMLLLGALDSLKGNDSTQEARGIELLNRIRDGEYEGSLPVPRSASLDHKAHPTTTGVHLYHELELVPAARQLADGQGEIYPLLFADCEGFGSGTNATNAALLAPVHDGGTTEPLKLDITAKCYSGRGQDPIDLFYARVLYAISDVVVYVTDRDQEIVDSLKRIMEWAAAAVDKSFNQFSSKTLIIVRNKETAPFDADAGKYTDEQLRQLYLQALGNALLWDKSDQLATFVGKYNQTAQPEKRIISNNDLFDALFREIKCCYIPNKGEADASPRRAPEVLDHLETLHRQIKKAAEEERLEKSKSYTKFNVSALDSVLYRVFDHFRQSDNPLDFYQASRRDNPTPRNASQHIGNLLRLVYENRRGNNDGVHEMLIKAIALMMVISVRRENFDLAPAKILFHSLKSRWDEGLEVYLRTHEQCEFYVVSKDGSTKSYCTVRGRYSHNRHMLPSGTGSFRGPESIMSRRSWSEIEKQSWSDHIQKEFETLFHSAKFGTDEVDNAIRNIRHKVYREHNGIWKALQSSKTCLACLQSVPDHALKCGHSYCPRCIQEIGAPSRSFEYAFDMDGCPLCDNHEHTNPHQIQLKPRCAGVRVLTLDGGGIRGIVELVLLREIEKEVGLDLPMSEFFDLVVGTSTGGIVALAVVMSGKPLDEMISFFHGASEKTFKNTRTLSALGTTAAMLFGGVVSKYKTAPLRKALEAFFDPKTSLFAPAKTTNIPSPTRVAVTAAQNRGDTLCVIGNYNRTSGDWEHLEREDNIGSDFTVVDAALATSAAPYYLRPFQKVKGGPDYVDGAVYANCPVKVAVEEMHKIWDEQKTPLDALISLGTGHQTAERPSIPRELRYQFFEPVLKMFERQMDTDVSYSDLQHFIPSATRDRFKRLNPPVKGEGGRYIGLNDWKETHNLERDVAEWAKNEKETISNIASMLIASLFFFEPDPPQTGQGEHHMEGSIRCRLRRDSPALTTLRQSRISEFCHTTVPVAELPSLVQIPESRWRSLSLEPQGGGSMGRDAEPSMFRLNCALRATSHNHAYMFAEVLAVKFKETGRRIPISGFPATLAALKERAESRWVQ